jgi:hypothetical protein
MSSVPGLKAKPQIPKEKPVRSSPKRAIIFWAMTNFCALFTFSTAVINSAV